MEVGRQVLGKKRWALLGCPVIPAAFDMEHQLCPSP